MALEMTRIRIIGMKPDLRKLILLLGRLGLVQIDGISETSDIAVQRLELTEGQRKEQQRLSGVFSKLEIIQETLGCHSDPRMDHYQEGFLKDAEEAVEEILPRLETIATRRETLEAAQATLPRYEITLKRLIPEIPDSARNKHNQTIGVIVRKKNLNVLEILRSQISEVTQGHVEIIRRGIDDDTWGTLIIFPRVYSEKVREVIGERDVTRFQLPDEFSRDAPDTILSAIQRRIREIPTEIENLDQEIDSLHETWCPQISFWKDTIEEDLNMYEMFSRLGQTDTTIILHGWIQPDELPQLKQTLADEFGSHIAVEELPIPDEIKSQTPIVLRNPKPVQPFESLVHLVASPTYEGMDPTWLIAVFLPIIFGMILGDAGYGAVLLILCLVLMLRFKTGFTADLLKVLAYGSGWAIVFGVLYGELFGTLGEELGMHPIWFHRAGDDVTSLLLLSLGAGVAHITLGLIIGVWTAIQEKNRSHLLERGGMLIGLAGLLILVGTLSGFLPEGLMNPAIAGIIVGIAILGSSMGWLGLLIGPIEFISLIGNILSYLRIAAIGLASVYLAQVANQLGGALGSAVVGILIAVLIHGLNIALGAFSPTIHSLRLHYVEFFRKFYEGGGRRFEPYKSKLS